MKRLALIAALAAAACSLAPSITSGQTAQGRYAAYHPGMQVSYPGYAPTPENMLYGGSPYPQAAMAGYATPAGYNAPAGYEGHADYGYSGCSDGSCGAGDCGAGCRRCRPRHWIFGYDTTADWVGTCDRRGYVVVEGLNWYPQGADSPPLLTTSPAGTPQGAAGVIGQPGTEVLIGGHDFDDEELIGGRIALGFWTMGAEYIGFEFNYTGFEQAGTEFNASSSFNPEDGGGILALPFFDASTGIENSLVLAFPDFQTLGGPIDTGGLPIDLNGSFSLDSDLEIHSAGITMKHVVWVLPEAGYRVFFVGGYRFFWLSDDIDMTSTISPVGGAFAAGTRLEVLDSFDTENQFHGGDLGFLTQFASGPWSIDILTKVALGSNHQSLEIAGETRSIGGGTSIVTAGGLFAQPTNIGEFSDDRFSVIPEASVNFGYQLTRRIKLLGGYSFLYMNRVLRAAEQIDRTVNPTQFDGGILVGDARPARTIQENEFWMHGVSTGIEVKW
jgi:hypothetical protein